MSNKIQVFDLSNASNVSLTSTGFKREGESAKYVCKITDATIVFVGDNSKFVTDNKKKQFNTISITLPKDQSDELKRIIDNTNKKNRSYSEYEGKIQFKVKLSTNTKIVNNDKKPIKIPLDKVPCTDLREYKDATIDIVVTGTSNEFEGKDGKKYSYISLTATQIKIKSMNSVFDWATLSPREELRSSLGSMVFLFHFGHHGYRGCRDNQSKWKTPHTFRTLIQHCSLSRTE